MSETKGTLDGVDWSTMEAGKELDSLVAERVMGMRVCLDWGEAEPATENGETVCFVDHSGAWRTSFTEMEPWAPSTDIAAAWEVVEKLGLSVVRSEDGWYAIKPFDIEHGCVRGTDYPRIALVGSEGERFAASDTPTLAICRAALATLTSETPAPEKEDR